MLIVSEKEFWKSDYKIIHDKTWWFDFLATMHIVALFSTRTGCLQLWKTWKTRGIFLILENSRKTQGILNLLGEFL